MENREQIEVKVTYKNKEFFIGISDYYMYNQDYDKFKLLGAKILYKLSQYDFMYPIDKCPGFNDAVLSDNPKDMEKVIDWRKKKLQNKLGSLK